MPDCLGPIEREGWGLTLRECSDVQASAGVILTMAVWNLLALLHTFIVELPYLDLTILKTTSISALTA